MPPPQRRIPLPEHRSSLPGYRISLPNHRVSFLEHGMSFPAHRASLPMHREALAVFWKLLPGHWAPLPAHRMPPPGLRLVVTGKTANNMGNKQWALKLKRLFKNKKSSKKSKDFTPFLQSFFHNNLIILSSKTIRCFTTLLQPLILSLKGATN